MKTRTDSAQIPLTISPIVMIKFPQNAHLALIQNDIIEALNDRDTSLNHRSVNSLRQIAFTSSASTYANNKQNSFGDPAFGHELNLVAYFEMNCWL